MKKFAFLMATAAIASALPASAATYLPFGPQTNVALSTVTNGGWTLCFQQGFGTAFGNSAAAATAGCSGNRLLLAGRATGSNTLLALAQTTKADALFNTGAANNGVTHISDGTGWYNADLWSWGFAPAGQAVNKFECDTNSGNGRICIHTFSFVGGYRVNNQFTFGNDFEKLVFTDSNVLGGVPEPTSWALMIAGFGLVGAATRRRQRVSVTYA